MPKKEAISATRRRITAGSQPRFSGPKASSCQTRSVTIWFSGDCPTYPMLALWARSDSPDRGLPAQKISPRRVPWGARAGLQQRRRLDFPLPDRPHKVTNSPASREAVTPLNAGVSCPG